jgi:apolipoprotein N-acyltransferase
MKDIKKSQNPPGTWIALVILTIFHFLIIYLVDDRKSVVWFELPVLASLFLLAHHRQIDSALALCFSVVCMFLLVDPAVGFGYVIWFSILPYFFILDEENRFWILAGWGLWTGMLIASGIYAWIWRAVMVFFEFGALSSFPLFLVFSFLIGIQHAVFLPLARYLKDRFGWSLVVIVPALYTVIEYWMPLPMPIALSVGLVYQPFFLQPLDILGMHGVSLLIAVFSAALYFACISVRLNKRKIMMASIGIAILIISFQILYGLYGFSRYKDDPGSPSVDIAMIQPVSPLKVRNADVQLQELLANNLKRLSFKAIDARDHPPDLLIWPEGAGSFSSRTPEFNPPYMRAVIDIQRATSATLLVQDVEFVRMRDTRRLRYYSTASLVLPVGNSVENYRKNILMPFGEYLPMEDRFPILRKIFSEARSVLPGKEANPISGPGGPFAALICYEVIFPNYVRKYVGRDCRYIVNLTNDLWYGHRQQPMQHLGMTVLRAIENRKPIVRSTNSGISAFIDARGVIIPECRTKTMECTFLRQNLHPRKGVTFYGCHGDILHRWLLTPLFLVILLYGLMIPRSPKANAGTPAKTPPIKPRRGKK